eukprot:5867030-Amphidinium_carterae.1
MYRSSDDGQFNILDCRLWVGVRKCDSSSSFHGQPRATLGKSSCLRNLTVVSEGHSQEIAWIDANRVGSQAFVTGRVGCSRVGGDDLCQCSINMHRGEPVLALVDVDNLRDVDPYRLEVRRGRVRMRADATAYKEKHPFPLLAWWACASTLRNMDSDAGSRTSCMRCSPLCLQSLAVGLH